jgi:hypothetical protein
MKFLVLFILIIAFNLEAKEYKSIHGFSIQVPNNYIVISNFNSADVVEGLRQEGYDSPFLKELNTDLPFEYFVKKNDLNIDNPDEININSKYQNYIDIEAHPLDEYCYSMQMIMSNAAGRNLEQYVCEKSDLPGKMIGKSFYYIMDSLYSDEEKSLQYQFFATREQLVTVTLNCSPVSCNNSEKVLRSLLKSMR